MISISLRYVGRLLGLLLMLMSASMVLALGWSIYDYLYEANQWRQGNEVIQAIVMSMAVGFGIGGALFAICRKPQGHLGRREALLLVSASWFAGAAIAALPFFLWARGHSFLPEQATAFSSYLNCYFEAMSGLTTTGATILSQIDTIPRGILFWRAFTHWLGGLGIVVIFVAVLPSLGGGSGKRLFRFESTGIASDGVTPNIKETSRVLLGIYLCFTILEIFAIRLVDPSVSWFSAMTHTFGTLATGGFSVMDASAGGLSPKVQWVIVAFMFLAGINFGLYQLALRGRFRTIFQNTELRYYVGFIVLSAGIIYLFIVGSQYDDTFGTRILAGPARALRDAFFQVISIQTTTGFASANFDQWPNLTKGILVGLMFIGGCGGSTGGGIKVIRIVSVIKIMAVELERAFRPSVVRPVRIGTHNVEYHQRITVLAYVLGIVVLSVFGSGALMLFEPGIDGITAVTASIASVNNIGPGLGGVGAVENFAWFSAPSKLVLCVLMAIGRLEVFAVLVVFLPRFWRTH